MVIFWPVFLSVCIVILTYVIRLAVNTSQTFKKMQKMGIKGPTPWPIVGNFPGVISEGLLKYYNRLYKEYDGERVFGVTESKKINLVLKDLDMIKDVSIKYFNNFPNRRFTFDGEPFDKLLTVLKDEHWKRVRSAVSPTFSTGKLRRMFVHIEETSRILVANLKQSCNEGKELELRKVSSCFTMDVIAGTVFGLKLDSFNDRDNDFMKQTTKIVEDFQGLGVLLAILFPKLPKLLRKVNIEILPDSSARYFYKFVDQAIANRQNKENVSKRHDILQLMMDAEEHPESDQGNDDADTCPNEDTEGLTRADIHGQALTFIIAGYDTVSTTMSYTLFLLAQYPEACKKAQEELDRVLGGKFPTYENIQELTYLEMCLNETLRMYPPAFTVDRECKEECTIQGIHIPKGVYVMFPIMGIHYDPNIWPDPDKFDPERFSVENKAGRHPFAYMPFGQGPRNCIGMRLAILEIKVALAAILQEVTPVPCEKTIFPVRFGKIDVKAIDGLWAKFVSRRDFQ